MILHVLAGISYKTPFANVTGWGVDAKYMRYFMFQGGISSSCIYAPLPPAEKDFDWCPFGNCFFPIEIAMIS